MHYAQGLALPTLSDAQQTRALQAMLNPHRYLYNHALAERKQVWETEQPSVSYGDQSAQSKAE